MIAPPQPPKPAEWRQDPSVKAAIDAEREHLRPLVTEIVMDILRTQGLIK